MRINKLFIVFFSIILLGFGINKSYPQVASQLQFLDKMSMDLALVNASSMGDDAKVLMLLNNGANPNASDAVAAFATGQKATGWTALMAASGSGHLRVVRLLIDKGATINQKSIDNETTALMYASMSGKKDVAEFLIDKGAKVNMRDKDGMTALMFASKRGHLGIVSLLLKKGANSTYKTKSNESALLFAESEGHNEIVKMLKGAGVKE